MVQQEGACLRTGKIAFIKTTPPYSTPLPPTSSTLAACLGLLAFITWENICCISLPGSSIRKNGRLSWLIKERTCTPQSEAGKVGFLCIIRRIMWEWGQSPKGRRKQFLLACCVCVWRGPERPHDAFEGNTGQLRIFHAVVYEECDTKAFVFLMNTSIWQFLK